MRMGKVAFIKAVNSTESGAEVFINAISLTIGAIDQLRAYIKEGVITPKEDDVRKIMKPEAVDRVMSGEIICPQMTYIVNGGVFL